MERICYKIKTFPLVIALLILMASSLVTLERLKRVQGYISALSQLIPGPGRGGGGGEDSHIKVTEMHLVSLRGINCRFCS